MGTLSDGLQIQATIPGFMPNLFEVAIFGEDNKGSTSTAFLDSYTNTTGGTASKFYCISYELPAPALTLKRDPLNKQFYVSKYNIAETVSITWQENQKLEVWNYHQNWLRQFYLREKDWYISGHDGKKKNAHITVQQYVGYGAEEPSSLNPDLKDIFTIRLIGLIPQSIPPLHGDWNQDASNSMNLVIKYYVDYIAITQGDDNGTADQTFYRAQ